MVEILGAEPGAHRGGRVVWKGQLYNSCIYIGRGCLDAYGISCRITFFLSSTPMFD